LVQLVLPFGGSLDVCGLILYDGATYRPPEPLTDIHLKRCCG